MRSLREPLHPGPELSRSCSVARLGLRCAGPVLISITGRGDQDQARRPQHVHRGEGRCAQAAYCRSSELSGEVAPPLVGVRDRSDSWILSKKGFRDFRKAFRDFPSYRKLWCERGDSNPHAVKHRNLNPETHQSFCLSTHSILTRSHHFSRAYLDL